MKKEGARRRLQRRVAMAEADSQALELAKRGLTQREIARATSESLGNVNKRITRALQAIRTANAGEAFQIDLQRIERMWAGLWDSATKGDPKAVLAGVRLLERRARMFGYDAPERHEHSGPDGGPVELHDELLRRLARLASALTEGAPNPEPQPG
jgi:hypothetical protein